MKKALLEAVVTRVSGTEFDDGGRTIKVSLEDGYSFNIPERSPLARKLYEGYTVDLTYTGTKSNTKENSSGGEFTFNNLTGVKIISITPGELADEFKDLPDFDLPEFKKVGGGSSNTNKDTGSVGKA